MEGNNRPLALNSWVDMSGSNSYLAAIEAVDAVFDKRHDPLFQQHPNLMHFIVSSLYERIASQSRENYDQYAVVEARLTGADIDYIQGNKQPAELVSFLDKVDDLPSIEIGRRTLHPGMRQINDLIDKPIRQNLDQANYLETTARKSAPLYRIKNLNVVDDSEQYYAQIDRKRVVRQHFGGQVLTVVRNSIVLHNDAKNLPAPIRDIIRTEREKARAVQKYDYDQHSEELLEHVDAHLPDRMDSGLPLWMVPILTTYYSVKSDFIVAENLKNFEDDPDLA